MKKILLGILLGILIGGLGVFAYDSYYTRLYARTSAAYLFSPTEVKKDGKALTRAELLDLLLAKALRAQSPPSAAGGK